MKITTISPTEASTAVAAVRIMVHIVGKRIEHQIILGKVFEKVKSWRDIKNKFKTRLVGVL